MDLGLDDKIALVLIADYSLSKEIVYELAKEGTKVIVCKNGEKNLKKAVTIQQYNKSKIYIINGDISNRIDRNRVLNIIQNKIGIIDILITSSEEPTVSDVRNHPTEIWQKTYKELLENKINIIKEVLPAMKKKHWGRIITISSQAIKQPLENLFFSNAIRGTIVDMLNSLAIEFGKHNVTFNNIMLGYIYNNYLKQRLIEKTISKNFIKEIPLKRMGDVNEISAAIIFLASNKANYITRTSLPIDGGWIKRI